NHIARAPRSSDSGIIRTCEKNAKPVPQWACARDVCPNKVAEDTCPRCLDNPNSHRNIPGNQVGRLDNDVTFDFGAKPCETNLIVIARLLTAIDPNAASSQARCGE